MRPPHIADGPDDLDGCGLDFVPVAVADADLDAVILFADVDPADADALAVRVKEYEAVFGDA